MGLFGFVLLGIVLLEVLSYYDDAHNPTVAQQLALQDQQARDFMHQPFKPEMEGAPLASLAPSTDPHGDSALASAGKTIFESHACMACHGVGGTGTPLAPKIAGIGQKYNADQLLDLFNHPTAKMDAGHMPHFQFTPDDVKALLAYLDSQP